MGTKISWTNESWNPIIGCEKISPGCKNCYAEKMALRLSGIKATEDSYCEVIDFKIPNYGKWNGKTHFQESQLNKPLKRKKPTMYFVCSMGDLFHDSVPFEWVRKVFEIIRKTPQHTYQILTKRPDIMLKFFLEFYGYQNWDNVWLNVTTENQEQANKRIPILLKIPAKVRGVSVEPMLSEINLQYLEISRGHYIKSLSGGRFGNSLIQGTKSLDWVICGGESGHNARPIHPDWVRILKDQCQAANVPFFFKQWNKKSQGSELDGKEYKQFPKK